MRGLSTHATSVLTTSDYRFFGLFPFERFARRRFGYTARRLSRQQRSRTTRIKNTCNAHYTGFVRNVLNLTYARNARFCKEFVVDSLTLSVRDKTVIRTTMMRVHHRHMQYNMDTRWHNRTNKHNNKYAGTKECTRIFTTREVFEKVTGSVCLARM